MSGEGIHNPAQVTAHEDTHPSGGSDEIDSALNIAAMADLTTGKIWQGNANRPSEVDLPAAGATVATGSYTGDNSNGRQITVGFKCSMVIIYSDYNYNAILIPSKTFYVSNAGELTGGSGLHASNGFIVYFTGDSINNSPNVHYYWAISE